YNYNGDVYAGDEARMLAEMQDLSFRLGTVDDSFETLFGGSTVQAIVDSSCHETMPGCSECAFAPYCGADPVFHWATQGDPIGHRPTSEFCARQMGMFELLCDYLRGADDYVRRLLWAWSAQ